ncbi:unnamed protein product [Arctogadus glacialis]
MVYCQVVNCCAAPPAGSFGRYLSETVLIVQDAETFEVFADYDRYPVDSPDRKEAPNSVRLRRQQTELWSCPQTDPRGQDHMEMRWRTPVGCPGGGVVVLNMTLCRDSETCHSNVVSVHSVGSETDWMNCKSVIDVITFTFTFTLSGALGHSC